MYQHLNNIYLFLMFILFLGNTTLIADQQSKVEKINVYVWNFDAKSTNSKALANDVTEEFEEALINSHTFRVLDRRNFSKVFTQREQEAGIKGIEGFNDKMFDTLKSLNAEYIVFGEVDFEDPSGEIKFRAYLQNLDTEIIAKKTLHGARALRLAPKTRMKLIGTLVDSIICQSTAKLDLEFDDESKYSKQGKRCGFSVKINPPDFDVGNDLMWQSILLPGLGHILDNKKRGYVYTTAFIASAIFSVTSAIRYNSKLDELKDANSIFDSDRNITNALVKNKKIEEINDAENLVNTSLYIFGGLYVVNLTDVIFSTWLNKPAPEVQPIVTFPNSPQLQSNPMYGIKISW
ncbi:MAG: CsgG/HfaB family protein [Calditrichia bacterium]